MDKYNLLNLNNRDNKLKLNEERLRDLRDVDKRFKLHVTGVPKGEERECGNENPQIFLYLRWGNFLIKPS